MNKREEERLRKQQEKLQKELERDVYKRQELIRIRGICLCRERLRKQALSAAGQSSLRKVRRPETKGSLLKKYCK